MPLTNDQALAILNNQLAKVDNQLIRPLKSYTVTRDLPIANDLDRISETLVMRTIEGFAQGSNRKMTGRSWLGRQANDLKGVGLTAGAKAVRVFTGGREASWTALELERAQAAGIQLDTEQISIINEKFQDDMQYVGYLGDPDEGIEGLCNSTQVKSVQGSGLLAADGADPDKLTEALDGYIGQAYDLTNNVVAPAVLLVAPADYAKLFSIKRDTSTKSSVLQYLEGESFGVVLNGSFQVHPVKELTGASKSGKNRAILYTPNQQYLKFSVMSAWREKTYDRGLQFCAAYLWRMAEVQFRRPETVMYIDNL